MWNVVLFAAGCKTKWPGRQHGLLQQQAFSVFPPWLFRGRRSWNLIFSLFNQVRGGSTLCLRFAQQGKGAPQVSLACVAPSLPSDWCVQEGDILATAEGAREGSKLQASHCMFSSQVGRIWVANKLEVTAALSLVMVSQEEKWQLNY